MEKKPLSLEELLKKFESEKTKKKINEDVVNEELQKQYDAQQKHIMNTRKMFEKTNTHSTQQRSTMGGTYTDPDSETPVEPFVKLRLGAFTDTEHIRETDNDFNSNAGTYSLNLPGTLTTETFYEVDTDTFAFTEKITATELYDGDGVGSRRYSSFAYNTDDGHYYYTYYNESSDATEFRKIHPETKVTTQIDTLIGGFFNIPDLIYLGSGDFGFIDPTESSAVLVSLDVTGDAGSNFVLNIDDDFPLNIFKGASNHFLFGSFFDIDHASVVDYDLGTETIGGVYDNIITFDSSIDTIEPFASFTGGVKVVETIAVASSYEALPNTLNKVYANLLVADDDDLDPIVPYYVIAELNPTTGVATYVTRGEGISDLSFYCVEENGGD